MERFVFFNTDNASVLHYADYLRDFESIQKLAMDSYSLLQTTSFALKSIFYSEKLICFAKDPNHPLAVTLEFSENVTTEQDGSSFAEQMLQLFMQQFGHILNSKVSRKSFKAYNKSLKLIIDQVLEPIMEKIADFTKADFLYLSFLKTAEKIRENLAVNNTKTSFFSPSSSMNTDIMGMDRLPKSQNLEIKKKYPFILEREMIETTPQQLFYRLYSKDQGISPQVISIINTTALLANELILMEKDELQMMELCLGNFFIKAVKYNEMLLVVSVKDQTPSISQVKQLYSWAKFLIV